MRLEEHQSNEGWTVVQKNPTYLPGALYEVEGQAIRWHSPESEVSSQVFCISAFGGLRLLPDGYQILNQLFAATIPHVPAADRWSLSFEYSDADVLGETGEGTPTNIDVYCVSPKAVVCIESKFKRDAAEGFGACNQARRGDCLGFYGRGSDNKAATRGTSRTNCRLEAQDGKREPRRYWSLARSYFRDSVFKEQKHGDSCPLANSNYQLMRNFLFAAISAREVRQFGVMTIVPERAKDKVEQQVAAFKEAVLSDQYACHLGMTTYDRLVEILRQSTHAQSKEHADFLHARMADYL